MRKLLAAWVGLAFIASVQADDKKDLDKFKGTWVIETGEREGQPFDKPKGDKVTFDGEKILIMGKNNREHKGMIKLDSGKKPTTIDITPDDGGGRAMLGIYEIKDDTLKICLIEGDGERPKDFKSEAGSKAILLTLKKQK